MKIMIIGNGKSVHIIRWVNSLCKNNQVFLLTTSDQKPDKDSISSKIQVYNMPFKAPLGYYLNIFSVRRIINKIQPDIINAHYASGYGTLARIANIKPLVLSVWGSDVYTFPYKSTRHYKLVKKNLDCANIIASTSNCMETQIRKICSNDKKIEITPFGTDIALFKMKSNNKSSHFKFGTVKTLSKNYGIDLLIESYAIFIEKLNEKGIKNNTSYDIYGEGPEFENLSNLIKMKGLDKYIKLKGYIKHEKLPQILAEFDVFLLGSEYESFGVAAVEAMSVGVPVIASNAEGFKEVVENNKTGFIIEKRLPSLFAEKMLELYLKNELRMNFSVNARIRVEKYYNWDDNVKTMINLYQKAVKEGKHE